MAPCVRVVALAMPRAGTVRCRCRGSTPVVVVRFPVFRLPPEAHRKRMGMLVFRPPTGCWLRPGCQKVPFGTRSPWTASVTEEGFSFGWPHQGPSVEASASPRAHRRQGTFTPRGFRFRIAVCGRLLSPALEVPAGTSSPGTRQHYRFRRKRKPEAHSFRKTGSPRQRKRQPSAGNRQRLPPGRRFRQRRKWLPETAAAGSRLPLAVSGHTDQRHPSCHPDTRTGSGSGNTSPLGTPPEANLTGEAR